jgi:pyrroline-5-carboxylate reductase
MTRTQAELAAHGVGIVGGTGWLGGAIAHALLNSGVVASEFLWISNRSGQRKGFETWSGVRVTSDSQELMGHCHTVLLSVLPQDFPALRIDARDHLLVSVMARVSIAGLQEHTGASAVVRALPNAAAELGKSFTPWFASEAVTAREKSFVATLFGSCGETAELQDEAQIDYFTALTGSGPAFLAFYADCMIRAAVSAGIDPGLAERAVRQLFRGGGALLTESPQPPAEIVQSFVNYAGTTAAGLRALASSQVASDIAAGLDAAHRAARML